jgi:hypothetical protein
MRSGVTLNTQLVAARSPMILYRKALPEVGKPFPAEAPIFTECFPALRR